jgi:glycerophosphoryl diester phosphodiesterase
MHGCAVAAKAGMMTRHRGMAVKLVAHRGWSAGAGENTLAAFARAAGDGRVSGVELDVRRAADGAVLVVSHDPPRRGDDTLPFEAALTALAGTTLELLVELKEPGLAPAVIAALVRSRLADRTVVFAFAEIAASFPWDEARPVRLGAIIVGPWNIDRAMRDYRPDVLFIGWDERPWTRLAFRAWWSVFSLERLARRHRVPLVAGIVQRAKDLRWLSRQGVDAAVADFAAPQMASATAT